MTHFTVFLARRELLFTELVYWLYLRDSSSLRTTSTVDEFLLSIHLHTKVFPIPTFICSLFLRLPQDFCLSPYPAKRKRQMYRLLQ
jgi:hypothetical protein